MQRIELAPDYEISRVIRGGWQLAARPRRRSRATIRSADMVAFADAGITTFDCADIYTGVEELIGRSACATAMLRGDGGAVAHQGAHQVRARPRHAAAHHQEPMSRA